MAPFNSVLSVAVSLCLLALNVFAQTIEDCLRANGLDNFADLVQENPLPIFNITGVVVFAPSNDVVERFLYDSSIVLDGHSKQLRARNPSHNGNNDVLMQQSTSDPGVSKKKTRRRTKRDPVPDGHHGMVFFSGDQSREPIDAKVFNPSTGELYSGGGKKTQIAGDIITCRTGYIYRVNSFFNFATSFSTTVSRARLRYLDQIFARLPEALNAIACEKRVTFFAPTEQAFAACGLHPFKSRRSDLQAFLDDHTIISNDFIGYTPSLANGTTTYKSKSGKDIAVNVYRHKIVLNEARIVGQDHIMSNGVIQIIDKLLTPPLCPSCRR